MKPGGWKPGDSCVWNGKWAVLTYLMGQDRAIITLDDYGVTGGTAPRAEQPTN